MKKKTKRMWEALEKNVDFLRQTNLRQGREIIELREQQRRHEITIKGALIPFINDLASGVTDGVVTFKVSTDYQDHTMLGDMRVHRVAGPREWHCTYHSSAQTVEDGEVVRTGP